MKTAGFITADMLEGAELTSMESLNDGKALSGAWLACLKRAIRRQNEIGAEARAPPLPPPAPSGNGIDAVGMLCFNVSFFYTCCFCAAGWLT